MRVASYMALCAMAAAAASLSGCNREDNRHKGAKAPGPTIVEARLLDEFAGAYTTKTPTPTGLKTFVLEAAPTSVRLRSPKAGPSIIRSGWPTLRVFWKCTVSA